MYQILNILLEDWKKNNMSKKKTYKKLNKIKIKKENNYWATKILLLVNITFIQCFLHTFHTLHHSNTFFIQIIFLFFVSINLQTN